jgi:hypothetical protein
MIIVFCKELINKNLQIIKRNLCVNFLNKDYVAKDKIVSFHMKLKILIHRWYKISRKKFALIFKKRDNAIEVLIVNFFT